MTKYLNAGECFSAGDNLNRRRDFSRVSFRISNPTEFTSSTHPISTSFPKVQQ